MSITRLNRFEEQAIIKEVQKDGLLLEKLPSKWQSNKKVVLEAVRQNGLAIRYAPKFQSHYETYENDRGAFLNPKNKEIKETCDEKMQEILASPSLNQAEKEDRLKQLEQFRTQSFENVLEEFSQTPIERTFTEQWKHYKNQLDAPLSSEDIVENFKKAQMMEARLRKTKARIAKELAIPLRNITFLPQSDFHIDMEVFIPPKEPVVLNDYEEVKTFLDNLPVDFSENLIDKKKLRKFVKSTQEYAEIYKKVQKEREHVLTSQGISFYKFPAVFRIPNLIELNYCNGIFLGNQSSKPHEEEKFVFVTTGPSFDFENKIHSHFIKLFIQVFPNISILPIPGMSQFIQETDGGIRCLTIECFNIAANP